MAYNSSNNFFVSRKTAISVGAGVVGIVLLLIIGIGGFGMNNVSDWQIKQSLGGSVSVIDAPGWYLKMFGSIWTYPRAYQTEYGEGEGDTSAQSIRVTFNDGGTAKVSSMIRFATPKTEELRLLAHREFGSIENMAAAVRAHLVNCVKASGPLMSSSEHQTSRKAEFTQIVDNMLREGIYEMRQVETVLKDQSDQNGSNPVVLATEVIRDSNGNPLIAQKSPLNTYGIEVLQFSVTATDYDDQTLAKFSAKKESFLRAEQSKAEREEEIQQRLMVIEKGKRELAEVEAAANKEKMTATVNAEREAKVASIDAQKKVTVAEQTKKEAEMMASQKVEVAKLELEEARLLAQAADEKAKAIKILAQAEEEKINKAGAITEQQRVLAEIAAQRDVDVAAKLSMIQVPSTLFISGNGPTGGSNNMTETLLNMKLMSAMGIIEEPKTRAALETQAKAAGEKKE